MSKDWDDFPEEAMDIIHLVDLDTDETITVTLDENNTATTFDDLEKVKNPSHYQKENGIETIEFIKAVLTPEQLEGYLLGNCIKYCSRYNEKDTPAKNAIKIEWYAEYLEQLLIERMSKKHEKKD